MVNTIELIALIQELKKAQIELWVENGRLKTKASKGSITPAIRQSIKDNLDEIIRILSKKSNSNKEAFSAPIPKVEAQKHYVLSNAQRRLWIRDQMDANLTAYNIAFTIRLKGALNINALEQAFQVLFERHEALRTRFITVNGEGRQVIDNQVGFSIELENVVEKTTTEIQIIAQAHADRSFDLEQEHLLKIRLLKIEEQEYLLLFNMHHIISDGWSMGILFDELSKIYQSVSNHQSIPLAELSIQYKDYATWQNALLEDENIIGELREFWKNNLAEVAMLDLPLDYPRPAIKTYNGGVIEYFFPKALTEQLDNYTKEQSITLFMALTALVNVLLYRYTKQTEITIGTPTAGRNHPNLHDQIGFYVNTVVLHNQINEADNFKTLLAKVKQSTLAAFEHELYPFDQLVEELELQRDLSRHPIFDVMIALENNEEADFLLDAIEVSFDKLETNISQFDLTFNFQPSKNGLIGIIEYNTDLFTADRIERMFGHLECLMESIFQEENTAISQLNILPKTEQKLLLETFNQNKYSNNHNYLNDKTIPQFFEEQVAKTPDNIALVFDNIQLTYKQLNEKSNQLANYLHQKYNTKSDDIIALQLERSEWMIIAILGVMKSGAAYLPIAPNTPKSRVDYMFKDSNAKALLTDKSTFETAQQFHISTENIETISYETQATRNPQFAIRNSQLAYIIYTSGSTGQPKGVMIEHRNVVNFITYPIALFEITPTDNIIQFSTYTFDTSVAEIFMGILTGASLFVIDPQKMSLDVFLSYIKNNKISILDLPPKFLNALEGKDLGDLRILTLGGEAPDAQIFKEYTKKYRCFNAYGPTEATVCTTLFEIPSDWSASFIPIGSPYQNVEIYIVDNQFNACPIGVAGELCISGAGLARGYLNNPELTAEKFINHPFKQGERLYKTGDLARWLPDGNIEFLGRVDHQLKIRGYRIEAGEIEQILLSHEAIQSAVIIGYVPIAIGIPQGKELVAYLVAKEGQTIPEIAILRTFLGESLPEYMIPLFFITLEKLPLTSSGKVNRKALPKPDVSANSSSNYVAPRNGVEQQLVEIWQRILNKENIGIYDNFFHLGGHSLRAIRLISTIKQQLSVEFKLSEIFTYPTIIALAEKVGERKNIHPTILKPIPTVTEQEHYALSNAQRRLWIPDQLEGQMVAYNMPFTFKIKGELNKNALGKAFETIIERHEILRTHLVTINGVPRQVIDNVTDFNLSYLNLSDQTQAKVEEYIIQNHVNYHFNLSQDYLMRVELLHTTADTHILLLNTHHIISDGWSNGILLNELATLYNAYVQQLPNPLQLLKIQYKDYADWQEQLLTDEKYIGELRQYWHQKLANFQPLELPTDYPRPNIKQYEGALCNHVFSAEILQKLEVISREEGTSIFVVLTSLIKTLLYKYTNQQDIIIGTGIAGRNHPDLYDQLGFYVNTLALRSQFNGTNTFTETLRNVKQTILDAFEHDGYPFDMMVEELGVQRDLSRNPIFDISIVLQNNEEEDLIFNGLKAEPIESDWTTSKFDLSFFFDTNQGNLDFTIEYSTNLFKRSRIERLITHFGELMNSIFANANQTIDQLNILSKQEKNQLLKTFNPHSERTQADYNKKTLVQLFEEQAEKTPNNIALVFEKERLTYKELNEKSNQLADYLHRTYYTQSDDIIALQLDRSEWMIIAMLGVMKSGAAYLPIAPDTPKSRVAFMLKDSNAKTLLTDTATFETANQFDISTENIETISYEVRATHNPQLVTRNSQLAYVIYTSGSTGQPKGTLLEHSGTANMLLSQIETFELTEKDNLLQFANYAFDASVYEIYQALFSGATLVLATKEKISNPNAFANLVNEHQITMVTLPPVFLASLEQRRLPSLRIMVTAGEAPIQKDVAFYSQQLRYFNAFGPTECSVCVSIYEVKPSILSELSVIPIGQPIANTCLYILNKNDELQPIGVIGELCVSGAGLARGYLNNEKLTAEKFINHPFKSNEKLYKTGDLARWLPDGNIEFLGRIDYQLKIRGYRIEAGEIEQAILKHPAIKQTVILGRNFQDEKVLQAFIVPEISELNKDTKEEAQDEILENWQEVFDSSYGQETENLEDLTFDIAGWMNSFLNTPIPAQEMKEWVEKTSIRIADLKPKKALEVGVGTGMFLARIAPIASAYTAVDLSAQAVAKVQRMIDAYSELSNATVAVGVAHDLPNIPKKSLDTVIVNSVVQYFPNQGYLTEVLQELIALTQKGGHVFFGDIRSYPLLKAFHAEAQYHQMSGTTAQSVFKRALNDAVDSEKELAVHPAYFYALQQYISVPIQVDIALKEGEYWNELSQYRYDVTIKIDSTANEKILPWKDWKKENWTIKKVQEWLENGIKTNNKKALALKNIPNARVEKGTKTVDWAYEKIEATQLGVFKAIFEKMENETISPQVLWNLIEPYKDTYELRINWSVNATSGAYDVAILPKGQLENQHLIFPIEQQFRSSTSRKMYCNYPMQNELRQRLIIELKNYLSEQLPDYMIPQYFTPLEEMPLTSTGKIDRKALPPLEILNLASANTYIAPRNETETILVEIWEKVLRRTGISITDNFFDIGGHSLRAIRLVSLIQQDLSVEIKLNAIFDSPTIKQLAKKVMEQKEVATITLQPITTIEKSTNYALSNAQRRLWVLDQMDDNLTAYNMPVGLFLKGDLNIQALETTFQILINRHEALRTRFLPIAIGISNDIENRGRQIIDEKVVFKLTIKEAFNATEAEIQALSDAHADYVFDLEKEHLINIELLKTNAQEYVLLLNMHHIISDGWSMGVFFNELSEVYQSLVTSKMHKLPNLAIQYKDYAAWQNTLLEDEKTIGELRNYWTKQLADFPTLDLPLDAPRPSIRTYNGDALEYQFSRKITDQLKAYTQAENATLFMTLTALVNVLFYRYSNQTDIVIGTPTAGRHHPDLHHQIGFYLNTLALRNQIDSEETFKNFLTKVKKTALDAFEHELYPFERLLEDLNVPRDLSRSVIFDVLLVFQNTEEIALNMEGVAVSEVPIETKVTKFDLNFHFEENEEGLFSSIFYNTDIFNASRIQRMFFHLETLMQNIFDQPGQTLGAINILPSIEAKQVLGFNSAPLDLPSLTLHELFEAQVQKKPHHIAVKYGENELTYQQLNEKSNQVAHYLIQKYHIQADDIIAFMVDRSEWILIAMLGIHKSGAAYLPLAADTPNERAEFIVNDSQTKILLVEKSLITNAKNINSTIPVEVLENIKTTKSNNPNRYKTAAFTPNNLAAVLYTSGSTGVPKGVLMPQKALVNSLFGFKKEVYEQYSGFLQTASTGTHTFDASIRILMGSLIGGHTVHLIDNDLKMKGQELFDYFTLHQISITDSTPTLLNIWLNSNIETVHQHTLKHILVAGEILNTKLLTRLFKITAFQHLRFSNLYGPSEVTGASTRQDISYENGFICLHSSKNEKTNWLPLEASKNQVLSPVPVGYPMPNYNVFILDKNQELAPIGIIGEIYISGESLANGYVNNEQLTTSTFITNPFNNKTKLYQTGDEGRWLENGSLDFQGRIDFQLKIRGYRVEAGEIEQVLLSHEAIQNTVVIGHVSAINKENSQQELVAYLLPKTGQEIPDIATLNAFLGDKLPNYMIPSQFIILDKLPLTSSGKVNRKLLPNPDNHQTDVGLNIGIKHVAPRNKIEKQLVKIWETILNKTNIGIHDDFFNLGGHSLKTIQLKYKIQQILKQEIKLPSLFKYTTIEQQAIQLTNLDHSDFVPADGIQFNAKKETTIFAFPPLFGLSIIYQPLAAALVDSSIYSFDFIEDTNRTEQYYKQIKEIQPEGPYIFFGYSAGGNLAFSVASYMEEQGETITAIIIGNSARRVDAEFFNPEENAMEYLNLMIDAIKSKATPSDWENMLLDLLENDTIFLEQTRNRLAAYIEFQDESRNKKPIHADIHFLQAEGKDVYEKYKVYRDWEDWTLNNYHSYPAHGTHVDLFSPPFLAPNAAQIIDILQNIQMNKKEPAQLTVVNSSNN